MLAKEVVLCDVCKQRVAISKCALCGADVCIECLRVALLMHDGADTKITTCRFGIVSVSRDEIAKGKVAVVCVKCCQEIKDFRSILTKDDLITIFEIIKRNALIEKL